MSEKKYKEMMEMRDEALTSSSYRNKQYIDLNNKYEELYKDYKKKINKIETLEKEKEKLLEFIREGTYVCLYGEFEDYEIDEFLSNYGYKHFAYCYREGAREGDGLIIVYDVNEGSKCFGLAYLDHCSCYGPLDNLTIAWFTKGQIKKIIKEKRDKKDYIRNLSDEQNEEIYKGFIDFIKKF